MIPAAAGDDEDRAEFVISRRAGVVTVDAAGAPLRWHVLLVGADSVGTVDGGTPAPHEQGTLVRAEARTMVITLQ